METRQGKIEAKELKFAQNKAPYATFTIDGMKYNTFDKDIIDNHNPDDFVEFTGEQGDRFWTLKTMKKIEEGLRTNVVGFEPRTNGAKEYHLSPEEVKCRALECAIEVMKTWPKEGTEDITELADKFVEWIRNGN